MADASFYVALLHGGNTAPPNHDKPAWDACPLNEVTNLLAADRDFYLRLRHGRRAWIVPLSHPTQQAVTVAAGFNVASGYGSMAEYLVLGMAREGVRVNPVPSA